MLGSDFSQFYLDFAPFLLNAAHQRLRRRCDDADEVVQQTLLFAFEHLQDIPSTASRIRRWLLAILDKRICRIRASRSTRFAAKRCDIPRAKLVHAKSIRSGEQIGTYLGNLAESVEELPFEESDLARTVVDLTPEERKLVFDPASSTASLIAQAAMRDKLRHERGNQLAEFSSESRILDFIRQHCSRRSHTSPAHYLSTFRTIERQRGRPVRIADLDAAFFERHVANASVSKSTRKRVVAVWNAAAQQSLISPPPRHRPRFELRHPMYWTLEQIEKAALGTSSLSGIVWGVPQGLFWPAMIRVAARTALPFRQLLKMSWSQLKSDGLLWAKLDLATIELLVKLEELGSQKVFPCTCKADLFHKHYNTAIRRAGILSGSLTRMERDILNDAALGVPESQSALRRNCHLNVIREYRRRIRQKVALPGEASMRDVVEAAKRLNLLDASVTLDAANPHSYTNKPRCT